MGMDDLEWEFIRKVRKLAKANDIPLTGEVDQHPTLARPYIWLYHYDFLDQLTEQEKGVVDAFAATAADRLLADLIQHTNLPMGYSLAPRPKRNRR